LPQENLNRPKSKVPTVTARIMMIIPTLVQGGAEKQMSLLSAGLPKDRFDVSVCVLTHSGPWECYLRSQRIPVQVIGKRFKVDPISFYKLQRHVKRVKPDLVHTWIYAANAYGRMAAKLAGVKKIVAGERCVDLWKTEAHFAVDRYLAKSTSAIVTNSNGVVDFYLKNKIGDGKFKVIPNGIDFEAADPMKKGSNSEPDLPADITKESLEIYTARARWRKELGLAPSVRIIASVARLWPQKRIKDLIWATDLVNCTRDDLHLVIAGEGPDDHELREFAKEAGVGDRVHFVGHLSNPKSLLQASDLYALASEYEGQSNSLMEAILRGVPVIVSDIPGNRDLVPNSSHGFHFNVSDRAGLAREICAALGDLPQAKQRATLAKAYLQQNFSLQAMLQNYSQLYQSLLG